MTIYVPESAKKLMELVQLRKRYDILFDLYVKHIHEHRLGTGEICDGCIELANKEIDDIMNSESFV